MRIRWVIVGEAVFGVIALAVIVPVLYYTLCKEQTGTKYTGTPSELNDVLSNPLMGLCPRADQAIIAQPYKTVWMPVIWRTLEPARGNFDWAGFEGIYQFQRWGVNGVRWVFRVILDQPSGTMHKDIPDWLYELTGGDGYSYDDPTVGKGYSPNYANAVLLAEHERFISELGRRYGQDKRLAIVQLGSLGHNGEWHNFPYPDTGIFPTNDVTSVYVRHYLQAFPNVILQLARPIADINSAGLFYGGLGDEVATASFVRRFSGSSYKDDLGQTQPGAPDFWRMYPSSGEFPIGSGTEYISDVNKETTISQVQAGHISLIGPNCFSETAPGGPYQSTIDTLLKTVGYRFYIQSVSYNDVASQGLDFIISLVVVNRGVAPFYYDWPVEVSFNGTSATPFSERVGGGIKSWIGTKSIDLVVPISSSANLGQYNVCLAIIDPATSGPGIDFANVGKGTDGRYCFGYVRVIEGPKLTILQLVWIALGIIGFTLLVMVVTYLIWRLRRKQTDPVVPEPKATVETGSDKPLGSHEDAPPDSKDRLGKKEDGIDTRDGVQIIPVKKKKRNKVRVQYE